MTKQERLEKANKLIDGVCSYGEATVTDEGLFLVGFIQALQAEEEDGTTGIHRAFDSALGEMLENGDEGVAAV